MDVRKITELRIPSMQHGHEANLALNPLWTGTESNQGFPHRLQKLVVKYGLVFSGEIMKLGGNRKHEVEIVRLRKPALRRIYPLLSLAIIALDAGAVPAGSHFLYNQAAVFTSQDELTVRFGSALVEVEQRLLVARRHILPVLPQVFGGEPVEDLDELVHALELNPKQTRRI